MLRRALVLAVLLSSVACGKSYARLEACKDDPVAVQSPIAATTPRPGYTERTVNACLSMTITGDTALTLDSTAKLKIVEIIGGKNPQQLWFFSVSPAEPVHLSDERLMLFSADLSPGLYRGPGRYTLSDAAGVQVAGKSGLGSGAYVQVYGVGDASRFRRYDVFDQPCTLDVGEDARIGSVDCPSLADAEGRTVALQWRWERM